MDNPTKDDIDLLIMALERVQKNYIFYPMNPLLYLPSVKEMDKYLLQWNSPAVLIGVMFNDMDISMGKYNFTLMYNGTNDKTLPQFYHVLTLALTDLVFENRSNFEIPLLFDQHIRIATEQDVLFIDSIIYTLTLGITFMIPMFTQNVVYESEKELKHQLFLVGASRVMYWTSKYICDYSIYIIVALLQYFCLGIIGKSPAFINNNPILVLIFYLIYGLDILSFSYLFSFLFKKTEDAVSKFILLFNRLNIYQSHLFIQSGVVDLLAYQLP
jgi:ABC-type multidrug transport system permease subunit